MQLTCLACGAVVTSQHRDFGRTMHATLYRPVFPEKGVKWLCPACRVKVEEHAVALLELLKGEIVPLWQLVPEKLRLKIVGANEPADNRAGADRAGG